MGRQAPQQVDSGSRNLNREGAGKDIEEEATERTVGNRKAESGNGIHVAPNHQSRGDVLRNREGMGHSAEGLGLMPMMAVASGRGGYASLIGRV